MHTLSAETLRRPSARLAQHAGSVDARLILTTKAPPKKPAIFLTNVSWLLETSKHTRKKVYPCIFLFAQTGRSNDDVGVARGTVFQALRRGAGFKTDDFVEEKIRGAIVERLASCNQTKPNQIKYSKHKRKGSEATVLKRKVRALTTATRWGGMLHDRSCFITESRLLPRVSRHLAQKRTRNKTRATIEAAPLFF